ncbi:dual specificity phosphatase, catalytic domain protein [Aspergillus nomiae NRRL 13137]|uniref:phosphatidylinositol-3,4,5-trisphosphate 3-phosphatase n=1 Tax=Aspergillus nomiae NRRL (strain ATCC 15546 / NRRL 13137 / CBS 260.88 / M93) TaxID=1509407 RepID=A0A0L1INS8_ASPN3|nr:dual specificity phosphatase, catalytic domain protein [Aspergillus nomiae NRRL 13137]KNG80868.1 dual specificity phosphatase, catalytic domain protein [Aspergillus nomiae NRRL 13137]
MQLSSVFTVALSALNLASALPLHRLDTSPALSWHVSNFNTGCSPGGCVYNFNITGVASQNTPGFQTHCSGTNVQDDYAFCDDKLVKAKVVSQLYPVWTVHVQHAWFHGEAEFYALGHANVTSTQKNFTIPVTEASILRQIVAGPRLQHPEAGLDLCYVTDNLIATSGPSPSYPKRAYRNPLDDLVKYLDSKHGEDWCVFEFRAEGTGYPDKAVYGRIHHYPFPDHHPPPFALIPSLMGSMYNWLHGKDSQGEAQEKRKRVAVVHCKAGKGRSGTVACSYLMAHEGWKMEDALQRFTARRMRSGFGPGVSIPSQLRWVGYVDRWVNQMGKMYIERPVEILELHVWGLRDGVKVAVEGFVDEGKKIQNFHLFKRSERIVVDDGRAKTNSSQKTDKKKVNGQKNGIKKAFSSVVDSSSSSSSDSSDEDSTTQKGTSAVLFRPSKPLILPTSDINIDFERRSKAYKDWAMVTSIAHVWFNAYFEGGDKQDSGVFEAEWDTLDGIKGTSRKGVRALDRLKVVWRYPPSEPETKNSETAPTPGQIITEPKPGEPMFESHAADWRGQDPEEQKAARDQENIPTRAPDVPEHPKESKEDANPILAGLSTATSNAAAAATTSVQMLSKDLGLRRQTDESKDVSLAESEDNESVLGHRKQEGDEEKRQALNRAESEDFQGVQSYFGNGDKDDSTSSPKPTKAS